MKKIEKNCHLSTKYKKWEEKLAIPHPKYDSKGYYQDIVMQLLYSQNGLCAYTEQRLCAPEFYQKKHWCKQGTYQSQKPFYQGQLDHFDSDLKKERGWAWDNFFMVDSDVNTKVKGSKKVHNILKPDRVNFDPKKLFTYSKENHRFTANPYYLTPKEQAEVNEMLETLGVNWQPIIRKRKKTINQVLEMPFFQADEFPTAIKMYGEEESIYDDLDFTKWV